MPFLNQLGCFAIFLMLINFGVRIYIFNILDRLINGEDVSIKHARYPLYFMLLVLFSLTLAGSCGLGILLQAAEMLLTQNTLKIPVLSLTQSSVILILGVLNGFLIMRPLKNKITTLSKRN